MTAIRTPPLSEVIRLALDARLLDLHVALPGRVDSYDPVKQSVDVVPLLMGQVVGPDGQSTAIALQKIPNVPVLFPGGGGYRTTFPIAQGDTVLLIIADRSLDTWKAKGGVVDPKIGAHSLPDAIAIPGLHSFAAPLSNAPTDQATLGFDTGPLLRLKQAAIELGNAASQGVGLGDAMKTFADAVVSTFNSHVHPFIGVAPGVPSTTSPTASPLSSAPTMASSVAKVTP